jgi:hypothetical protein
MKFMASWRIPQDKRHETLKAFSKMTKEDDQADMGPKVKLIGRWHDLQRFTGVAICEADDAQAIASWMLNWNGVLDIEVVPVLDDEETREVGRKKFL